MSEIQTQKQEPSQAMQIAQRGAAQLKALVPHEGAFNDLADVNATRGRRIILSLGQAMRTNPALSACSEESIKAAAYKCAALDLDPSGTTGEVWLVPIKGKCEVWLGVQGMLKLARRSGQIRSINCGAVRDGDDFEFTPTNTDRPVHHVSRSGTARITAFWAQVELVSGGKLASVVFSDEFDDLASAGKAKSSKGPWYDWPDRMVQLVAIRRALKFAPKSVIQMPQQFGLADDGEVTDTPKLGRDAREVVAETLALTVDTIEAEEVPNV